MRLYEFGVGKIVKGVNTTPDVGPNEIPNQAKKFGNKVSKNGSPPVNPGGKIYFKEAVEYSWPYDTSAKFKVDGMQYNIEFLPLSNSKKDGYEVEFSAVHGPRFTNSGLMGSSAIQVFGTVISAIEDFIRRENPDILYFTGDKSQNRVDLYSKLLKRREDELADLGYSIDYGSAGNKVEFTIAKNNVSESSQLNELFNTVAPYTMKVRSFEEYNDEDYYAVDAKFKIDDINYFVKFDIDEEADGTPIIDASFGIAGSIPSDNKFNLTGTGNQYAVLATVSEILLKYFDEYNPVKLEFSATSTEPSRVKAYDKGLIRLANKLTNYNVTTGKHGSGEGYYKAYIFTRKDISEAVIKLGGKPGADSPAMKMISKFNELTGENPLNPKQRVAGNAKAEIYPVGNVTVRLSDIQSLGGGDGTKLLKTICSLADEYGVTIKLMAYGYDNVPTEKLVEWYKRFGFESWSEFEEDDDGVEMVRDAQ